MSYDVTFLHAPDTTALIDALDAHEENPDNLRAPDPTVEDRKQRIAADIRSLLPTLQPFQFDYAKIAELQKCSIDEARRQYRHIELNEESEPGLGLQITVCDDQVSLTIPYWHGPDKARHAFDIIGRIGAMLRMVWSLRAFDPQLEREVTFPADIPAMLAAYMPIVNRLNDLPRVPNASAPRRPWWKLW